MLSIKILLKEMYHLLKNKNGRRFLWLAFLKGSKKRFQPQKVKFAGFRLQVADSLSFIWQIKEIFVDHAYKFHTPQASPLIYDCGANVGTSCMYFKQMYPQAVIKAFEADQKIAKILENNIQQNNLTNVEVIAKAVWTDNQGIEIASDGADGASMFGESQKQHTPSIRLKDLLAKEAQVDMLKIDIEGAEIAVIEDCDDVLDRVQNLFVEYHAYIGQSQNLSKLLATLEKHQFRYFIRDDQDRVSPFVNHQFNDNNLMDLRLNIFAYKG